MTPTEKDFLDYALANPPADATSEYFQLLTALRLERVSPEVFEFLRPAHAQKVAAKAKWMGALSEARVRFGAEVAHTAALALSGEEFETVVTQIPTEYDFNGIVTGPKVTK